MSRQREWTDLIARDDLETDWVTPAAIGKQRFAIYDGPKGVFVSSALCSHAGADLCQGYFNGRAIECPLHQGLFDVETGRAIGAPAVRPIKIYPSRLYGDMVQVFV